MSHWTTWCIWLSALLLAFAAWMLLSGSGERYGNRKWNAEPTLVPMFQDPCSNDIEMRRSVLREIAKNPKRRMRDAAKALKKPAASTKAQKALAEQREAAKDASSQKRSKRRAAQKQERFAQSKEKRKQKHRGH